MKLNIAADGVKKNSVRYDEAGNADDRITGIYIPKTRLMKLTGGTENWPDTIDMGDPALPGGAKGAAPVVALRKTR